MFKFILFNFKIVNNKYVYNPLFKMSIQEKAGKSLLVPKRLFLF